VHWTPAVFKIGRYRLLQDAVLIDKGGFEQADTLMITSAKLDLAMALERRTNHWLDTHQILLILGRSLVKWVFLQDLLQHVVNLVCCTDLVRTFINKELFEPMLIDPGDHAFEAT